MGRVTNLEYVLGERRRNFIKTSRFNQLTVRSISLRHSQLCPCKTFSLDLFSALLKKKTVVQQVSSFEPVTAVWAGGTRQTKSRYLFVLYFR